MKARPEAGSKMISEAGSETVIVRNPNSKIVTPSVKIAHRIPSNELTFFNLLISSLLFFITSCIF